MSSDPDPVETAATVMALIERARTDGLDSDEYDRLMEPGLSERQAEIAERWAGEGRVKLAREDVEIPTLLDKLAAGAKLPWMVFLDDEWFVVKAQYGEGSYPHSRWTWFEDGYRFTYYNPRRDDCVPNISIREA